MSVELRKNVKSDEQIGRALRQRRENAAAKQAGRPLPFPSVWDMLDPTKLPAGASTRDIRDRHREFQKLCALIPRKTHTL